MLSKYVRKNDDCGCGGGKYNCVTKNTLNKWLQAELKRLDCGCGCKGMKGFQKKYGKVGGAKILADCPPGWRNDGLTCVEPCNADEFDDGLTCRKKCAPGQIDDGLTCRNPIKSEMNSCPAGSRDIAGTCWGPVRRDCVDDCFKHPAPGCRTWECGRLRGAFGEDWGPRWCTDCNLRCGQTCWDVQGITKQLHERNLRVWGGEVFGQQIRGKQIRGRVDFDELGKAVTAGLNDLFSADGALARAFDPEKNGVGAAFRKFGDDMKRVLEEVGNSIKNAFDRMGADIKKAFEDFAKDAESKFKQFGEDFVNKMKDPDFWVEAIGIMAQIAAAAVSIAITVGTLGAGSALAVGLMAAAQMAGPAAKMIADAARGRPIDVLDIVQLGISAATAMVPGMSSTVGAMVKTGANAAKYVVQGVQVGQQLGIIPSSCIANCPPEPPFPPEPPIIPTPPPSDVPPPPGQKTDEEILDLAPPCTFLRVIGKPNQPAPCNVPPKVTRSGPPYYTEAEWIAKYRADNYGPGAANQTVEDESGALVPKEDEDIKGEVDATQGEEVDLTDVEVPEVNEVDFGEEFGDIDFGEATEEIDFGEPAGEIDFGEAPTEEIDFGEPAGEIDFGEEFGDIDFGEELGAGKKRKKRRGGKLGPIIEPVTVDGILTNPGGTMVSLPAKANIPKTEAGFEFSAECYAENNPELAASVGNDKDKLTTHWLEIGSKKGWDADCGGQVAAKQRMVEQQKEKERIAGLKRACNASDRFFVEESEYCDGHRHADGQKNTAAGECKTNNGYWNYKGTKSFCNVFENPDGKLKTREDICNSSNNYWDNVEKSCDYYRNVDGALKTEADVCTGFDAFWDPKTKRCITTKNRNGEPITDEQLCLNNVDYWDGKQCHEDKYPDGSNKSGEIMCKVVDAGTEYTGPEHPYSSSACKNKLHRLPNSQKQKRELVDKYVLSPEMRFNEQLMKEVPELEVTGYGPERPKGSGRKWKLKGGMSRDEYNALLQRKREELRKQIDDDMEKQRIEFDTTFDDLINKKLDLLQYDASKQYDEFDVVSMRDPTSTSKYKAKLFRLTNTDTRDNKCNPNWILVDPLFDKSEQVQKIWNERKPDSELPIKNWPWNESMTLNQIYKSTSGPNIYRLRILKPECINYSKYNFQEINTDVPYFWFDFLFDRGFNSSAIPEWKNKYFQPDRVYLQNPPTKIEEEQVRRKIDLLEYNPSKTYEGNDIVALKDPKDPKNVWKALFLQRGIMHNPEGVLTYPSEGTTIAQHLQNLDFPQGFSPLIDRDPKELGYSGDVWIGPGRRWNEIINRYSNSQMYTGSGKKQKSLTLYYANWCPHCHDMMPEWKKLGGSYKGIKIQAIEQKRMKRKDINGFPTILFSDGQRESMYEGPRTKSGFVKFLKNNLK